MRIVSWNCYRGECRSRAERLASLEADLIFLQECGRPTSVDDQTLWFGTVSAQGVGVVARGEWTVKPGPVDSVIPDSVYPVQVVGPTSFNVLAVWAKPRPTYVRAVMEGLDHYREFLLSGPSLVIGDFNSHSRWDASDKKVNHTVLVERLRSEFGLVSAFHSVERSGIEAETPTLYWQCKEHQPFHIDYCFIPEEWVPRLRSVTVGNYDDWATDSDHRPLIVEVTP